MENNYVAIMAGGIGSRFWPSSSEQKPKQFLDILGIGKSLLQLTYERFLKLFPEENIFIVTNKRYKDLVGEQIPSLSKKNIILEPSRNNTAPSVAYTSFKIYSLNKDANIVMAPSDHIILKENDFIEHISTALKFVSDNNALVTLGILPTRPDTGYGYIELGEKNNGFSNDIFKVKSFKEKPDIKTAEKYLKSKKFLWNAGIFIWKSENILKAFEEYETNTYDILSKGMNFYNTEKEKEFIERSYPLTTKISVDFAIMEKAENIFTIPADIGWSDLGTWNSLYSFLQKDKNKNVVIGGNSKMIDSQENIIKTNKDKNVVIKDLTGYIVIDENNTLLIYPKNKEQEIKYINDN
ncbi:MAG TPA: mannose-1-phosphate guanylyltransferase [Bacteroidetes bacterium]|nr:mannose-1-phosphate guanylyltransferase [Bacteroidota bacterium]